MHNTRESNNASTACRFCRNHKISQINKTLVTVNMYGIVYKLIGNRNLRNDNDDRQIDRLAILILILSFLPFSVPSSSTT